MHHHCHKKEKDTLTTNNLESNSFSKKKTMGQPYTFYCYICINIQIFSKEHIQLTLLAAYDVSQGRSNRLCFVQTKVQLKSGWLAKGLNWLNSQTCWPLAIKKICILWAKMEMCKKLWSSLITSNGDITANTKLLETFRPPLNIQAVIHVCPSRIISSIARKQSIASRQNYEKSLQWLETIKWTFCENSLS